MDPEATKYQVRPRCIEFALEKAEEGPYWERLLAEKTKQHWLKVGGLLVILITVMIDGRKALLEIFVVCLIIKFWYRIYGFPLLPKIEFIPLVTRVSSLFPLMGLHSRWTLASGRTRMIVTQRAREALLVGVTLRR